jgi:uncharacterized protein YcbX
MRIGTVTGLWRYPVKSMAGERVDSVALTARGIPGDRGWAIYDESRNGISGGKRLPALRTCGARYMVEPVPGEASPPAEIALPDGTRVHSDTSEAATRLGTLLGRPVTLRALGPSGSASEPRLTMEGETPETVRALNGLLPGEPMPDFTAFAPEKLRLLRQGNYFDAYPIHLLTRTTLQTLTRLAPESMWDERRFRPNLLVDAVAVDGYPEMEWIGRRLRVGTAVIEVVTGCPRCVMVTQAADEVPQDHRVMRTLVRETKHIAGVYARVLIEGEVRPGDDVQFST